MIRVLPWYYISNYGRIYSVHSKKIKNIQIDSYGYIRVHLSYEKNKSIYTGVHKIELMSFCPIIENNIFIPHHKDNNPQNNYIENLMWVTVSENTRFGIEFNNYTCENNPSSSLSNNEVHQICKLIEIGKTNSEILNILGYEYGKARNRLASIIRLIRRGQCYINISRQYNIPGINGRTDYPTDFTYFICQALSDTNKSFRIDELCDLFQIPLEDRKMFANFVQDITRRQKDTFITNQFKVLKSPTPLPKNHPDYKYYY